jgi:transaldolase
MITKIFCDIAELNQIRKFNKKKIVKGFTTNPSLMRKAGAKDYKSYSQKIFFLLNLFIKCNSAISQNIFVFINFKYF